MDGSQVRRYFDELRGIGDQGWPMGLNQTMTMVGIPEPYSEGLEAWRRLLPKVQYECDWQRSNRT